MLLTILILISISVLFAPLSNIMLWKKYTNFTDGLAHASIMAAVISSVFNINILFGALINTFIFIIFIYTLKSKTDNNLIITIVSIFIMSLGLILSETFDVDLSLKRILFGDINLSHYYDLSYILILVFISYSFLFLNFNSIILMSLNKDLALSRGVKIKLIEITLLIIVSITIAICLKLIGSLMLFGILIIPPTISGLFAKSPKEMIIFTVLINIFTSLICVILSEKINVDMSPLIICINFVIFVICKIILQMRKYT
jgi:zinc transport system permease protein